jgi:hypothetical protein
VAAAERVDWRVTLYVYRHDALLLGGAYRPAVFTPLASLFSWSTARNPASSQPGEGRLRICEKNHAQNAGFRAHRETEYQMRKTGEPQRVRNGNTEEQKMIGHRGDF